MNKRLSRSLKAAWSRKRRSNAMKESWARRKSMASEVKQETIRSELVENPHEIVHLKLGYREVVIDFTTKVISLD